MEVDQARSQRRGNAVQSCSAVLIEWIIMRRPSGPSGPSTGRVGV